MTTPLHTPPHVADAILVVAEHLTRAGYGSCVVLPGGGASFSVKSVLDETREILEAIDWRIKELCRASRKATMFRNFIRKLDAFIRWQTLPAWYAAQRDALLARRNAVKS